jgi:hypothetical protein
VGCTSKKPDILDVVRRLVEQGAPINEVKYENEPEVFWERKPFGLVTPLHRAAELGELEVVKYLLEQCADPLKLDSREKVPRIGRRSKSILRLLKSSKMQRNGRSTREFNLLRCSH